MTPEAEDYDDQGPSSLQSIADDLQHIGEHAKSLYNEVSQSIQGTASSQPGSLNSVFFQGVQRFVTQWESLRQVKERLGREEESIREQEQEQQLSRDAVDNEELASKVCD